MAYDTRWLPDDVRAVIHDLRTNPNSPLWIDLDALIRQIAARKRRKSPAMLAEAEDVAQNVLMRLHAGTLATFGVPKKVGNLETSWCKGQFIAWLSVIIRSEWRDQWRRGNARAPTVPIDDHMTETRIEAPDELSSIEERIDFTEVLRDIQDLLARLERRGGKSADRVAWLRFHVDSEITLNDLARLYGVSPTAMRTAICRLRQQLRNALGKNYDE